MSPFSGRGKGTHTLLRGSVCPRLVLSCVPPAWCWSHQKKALAPSPGQAQPGERRRPSERGTSQTLPQRPQSLCVQQRGWPWGCHQSRGQATAGLSRAGRAPVSPALASHRPGGLLGCKGHGFVLWTWQRRGWRQPLEATGAVTGCGPLFK